MKDVPFYANHEDNMRCCLAVYRMIFDYFLHRKLSWDELASFAGYAPGVAAWTVKPLTQFAKMQFDIRMIEPFDYRRYLTEGTAYLSELFTPEKAAWQLKHTNILSMQPYIPEFLETIQPECRRATLGDIDDMLDEGRLVFVTLNSQVLNNTDEYVDHAVLVIDRTADEYVVHDPGLPPQPFRHVARAKLWEAMGGDEHSAEVTGFRLKKRATRLDSYVVEQKPRLSRAFAAKLIEDGKVLVNGQPSKTGYKVKATDDVTIDYDDAQLDAIPAIDLPILYEDDDCVVINKPEGVLTHAQGALSSEATVASFLRDRVIDMQGDRAGIVHRLDRATSGVIIGAKNQAALSWLQKQFADRQAKKTYIALVVGQPVQPEAVIDMPIERNPKAPATFRVGNNGKPATTQYKVLEAGEQYSLLELRPTTGRTHQLRVHLAQIGHPIVGDPLYGNGAYGDRLFLHALSLEITLPNHEHKTFTAPLPAEFEQQLHA